MTPIYGVISGMGLKCRWDVKPVEGRGESGYKRSWWFDESDSPKVSSIDLGHEWEDPTFDEVCEK